MIVKDLGVVSSLEKVGTNDWFASYLNCAIDT